MKFFWIPLSKYRSWILYNRIKSDIDPTGKILDLGSGDCFIAKNIAENINSNITCVDIKDINHTDLNLLIYDGKKIPFGDKSFDIVMLNFVLHHSENLEKVLEEARRVSKDKIIILEDTYKSEVEKLVVGQADYWTNLIRGVEAPLNFIKRKDWRILFKKLSLDLMKDVEFRLWYNPIKRLHFVLGVNTHRVYGKNE